MIHQDSTHQDFFKDAYEGAREDLEAIKAQRLEDRILNCGRPFYWYDPIAKKVRHRCPTCKHWTCERCNTERATEESARMDRALSEYGHVYVLSNIKESEWPTLMRKFQANKVTKNMYRRLPQDKGLAVFFVGPRSLAREVKARTLCNLDNTTDEQWYELARKRQGKRASGNLGQTNDDGQEGENVVSVKVVSIRSNSIDGQVHSSAIEHANQVLGERNPHDKADVEEMVRMWADAYESYLKDRGYHVYRLHCWQKMDLSAIQTNSETIAIKSLSDWLAQAWEGAKEEFASLGQFQEPVFS